MQECCRISIAPGLAELEHLLHVPMHALISILAIMMPLTATSPASPARFLVSAKLRHIQMDVPTMIAGQDQAC